MAGTVTYGLLCATWLVMKTEGALEQRMRELGRPIALALLATIGIVSHNPRQHLQ